MKNCRVVAVSIGILEFHVVRSEVVGVGVVDAKGMVLVMVT